MAQFVIANNVNTQLAAALPSSGAGSTTVVLASAANLPTLTGTQQMPLALNDAATGAIYEVVYATAITGATLTVIRAQEGTAALNWSVGDIAFCGPTEGTVATAHGNPANVFDVAPAVASTNALQLQQAQGMRASAQSVIVVATTETLTAAQTAGGCIRFTGSTASQIITLASRASVSALTPNSFTYVTNVSSVAFTLAMTTGDTVAISNQSSVSNIVMEPGDDLLLVPTGSANIWLAVSGSALRQFNPLVISPAVAANQAMQLGQATGRWLSRVIYATAGTFTETPPAGALEALYDVNGAGGGGGGSAQTVGAQASGGAGGGAGGRALKRVANPTTQTITVGAAGTAGMAGANGGNGGSSSVGAIVSATGGSGGAGGTAGTGGAGQDTGGGVGTGGDVNMRGMPGLGAIVFGTLNFGRSGTGGSSAYGGGGPAVSGFSAGVAGQGNAAGGSGSSCNNGTTGAANGAIGTPGIVVVDYFS